MLTAKHIETALKAAGARTSGLVMTADKIANAFNEAILKYGQGQFNTKEKVAALVSECMMESAYFRTTEEYAKNGRYAPYIGRSFIQVTWRDNYATFGKWCKARGLVTNEDYFVNVPKRLADLRWAALGGVWYFTSVMFHGKPLTAYSNDIDAVGKAVNLGNPYSKNFPNGYRERRKAYNAVIALGASIVPKAEEPKPTLGVIEKVILDVLAKENLINVQRSVVTGDPKLVTTSIANVLNHFSQQVMEIKSSALSKTDVQLFEATVDDLLETLRARNAN